MRHFRFGYQVRATEPEELDLVVEGPAGALAGCCIAWYDAVSGRAEIEPLGIVPAHRRRGSAGAPPAP